MDQADRRARSVIPGTPTWWVKSIRELGAVGALTAIAGYTVFRLLSGIPTTADISEVKGIMGQHVIQTEAELMQIRYLLTAICRNTAQTDKEARGCTQPEK